MPVDSEHSALTEAVYYILLSLYSPLHGYGIMQNIKKLTNGRVSLGAGTLYGAVNALLDKGWITNAINIAKNEPDSRKKEYIITDSGKLVIDCEILRLRELIDNGNYVTGGVQSGYSN